MMMIRQLHSAFLASLFVLSLPAAEALAENGVFPDKIVFGQVAALEGPAQALGQGMREGILAAFGEVNRTGGINGRKLELKSLDDGYEPEKTIEPTKKLINEEKVFALVGAVGTPTSKAAQPIATEAKVPFIGPFTGAEFLRNPYNRYVVNVRGSYYQETEAWVEHLTKDLGVSKIAILYQDDVFGLAGLEGVKIALAKRNMSLVASGSFKRNTTAVKSALLDIMKAEPQAVVTVGPYKPIAEFVKIVRRSFSLGHFHSGRGVLSGRNAGYERRQQTGIRLFGRLLSRASSCRSTEAHARGADARSFPRRRRQGQFRLRRRKTQLRGEQKSRHG